MDSIGRIAVIIPKINNNTESVFIDAIHSKACEYGYDTIVISGVINYVDQHLDIAYSKGQTNIYDLILRGDFDGFIFDADSFCSLRLRNTILDMLHRRGLPCVAIDLVQPYFPVISADEDLQLYLSTVHLIREHSCRKLYCIGGHKGDIPSERRIDGFRRAMAEAGLSCGDDCIFYGDYRRDVPHRNAAVRLQEAYEQKCKHFGIKEHLLPHINGVSLLQELSGAFLHKYAPWRSASEDHFFLPEASLRRTDLI